MTDSKKPRKKVDIGLVVGGGETAQGRDNEATLIAALKEFVAFTVESYRDGMAEDTDSPDQFLSMAMETWLALREDGE